METGLRVQVSVGTPGDCPVADVTATSGATVTAVSKATATGRDGRIAEEFTTEGALEDPTENVEAVATYRDQTIYRFDRPAEQGCVCEVVEGLGYPVSSLRASDGALSLTVHVPDLDAVEEVVAELEARFSDIHLEKLTRSGDGADGEFVFVDRSRLTSRQREVLATAYEMGYFDHPKGANASEVAAALDISPSTFSEHLAAGQRKLLETIVGA